MNDGLVKGNVFLRPRRPLEGRWAHRPDVLERLHQLADTLEQNVREEYPADQAEERVSEQVRHLAQAVLTQWAQEANAQLQAQVSVRHPEAIRHGKKSSEMADPVWVGCRGGSPMAIGAARGPTAALL